MIWVVIYIGLEYNKSVIVKHENPNKNVKRCAYGTLDYE